MRMLTAAAAIALLATGCAEEAASRSEIVEQPKPTVAQPPSNQMELLEARLPTTTLSGSLGSVTGERGSWCWTARHTDGARMSACADWLFRDPQSALEARPGEDLTVSFNRDDDPERLSINVHGWKGGDGKPLDAAVANPTSFKARPVPGVYWVVVGSWWSDGPNHLGGDVFSYHEIRVT